MTSRVARAARRKSAPDRRAEIVAEATRLALADGIDQLTLRAVADRLGVVSSLVSHYFPAVDDLLVEAFRTAAQADSAQTYAQVEQAGDPVAGLRTMLRLTISEERDRISTLWLGAWYAGRKRPVLHAEVTAEMGRDIERLSALIERGRAGGALHTDDPDASAIRILAVTDGLSIQAVMRSTVDYRAVRELVFTVAERELGLPEGALGGD
ncbi:AcrR family transcriptional regulator [Pseudonocardia eucalypti]|uniref:TetR family transcriptional regulator C-terminal domain-containing protein n=1 Tax=Pseudonocardia eucalypti TaxID=648755 RepID=UPI001610B90F|nr:AcrR family transcriptional regulator [Pseudonocardia eucalypti]